MYAMHSKILYNVWHAAVGRITIIIIVKNFAV